MATMTTYYRIQPVGLSLNHTSDDWAGDTLPKGRLCAYPSIARLLSGEGDDWYRDDYDHEGPREVVEFTGTDPRPLDADVPGITVRPVRILRRTPLTKFLAKHAE